MLNPKKFQKVQKLLNVAKRELSRYPDQDNYTKSRGRFEVTRVGPKDVVVRDSEDNELVYFDGAIFFNREEIDKSKIEYKEVDKREFLEK